MMTRRDYEMIAATLRDSVPLFSMTPSRRAVTRETRDDIAMKLAEVFAAANPKFDRERFLAKAGVLPV